MPKDRYILQLLYPILRWPMDDLSNIADIFKTVDTILPNIAIQVS